MSRPLKVRIWDYLVDDQLMFCILDLRNPKDLIVLANEGYEHIDQYTGVDDKNGKEIYEGDIVSGQDVAVEYDRCVIKFFNASFLLMGTMADGEFLICGDFHTPELELEVVGNIYEH